MISITLEQFGNFLLLWWLLPSLLTFIAMIVGILWDEKGDFRWFDGKEIEQLFVLSILYPIGMWLILQHIYYSFVGFPEDWFDEVDDDE